MSTKIHCVLASLFGGVVLASAAQAGEPYGEHFDPSTCPAEPYVSSDTMFKDWCEAYTAAIQDKARFDKYFLAEPYSRDHVVDQIMERYESRYTYFVSDTATDMLNEGECLTLTFPEREPAHGSAKALPLAVEFSDKKGPILQEKTIKTADTTQTENYYSSAFAFAEANALFFATTPPGASFPAGNIGCFTDIQELRKSGEELVYLYQKTLIGQMSSWIGVYDRLNP